MKKKVICIFLVLIIISTCTFSTAAAGRKSDTAEKDIIKIDGMDYQYVDETINGETFTHIINLTLNTEDILYYNQISGTVFLNDEPIAQIENAVSLNNSCNRNVIAPLSENYWKLHDSTTKRITWVQGIAAAALAAVIATVIPNVGKIGVIAKIGLTALSVVAAACAGAYVDCVGYTHVQNNGSVQARLDWTFRPSTGDVYGPYSKYTL